jgi:hypothetical protein
MLEYTTPQVMPVNITDALLFTTRPLLKHSIGNHHEYLYYAGVYMRLIPYLRPFRPAFYVLLFVLVVLIVTAYTPLRNSDWVYDGWMWIVLAPLALILWILSQIVAVVQMKHLLLEKAGKHRIELFWYFVPLGIAIIVISTITLQSGAPFADGLEDGLIIMSPTVIYGLKYAIRGIKRLQHS